MEFPDFLAEPPEIETPHGLTKTEKAEFERLISARNATGDAVQQTEIDALIDYVTARTRLAKLHKLARKAAGLRETLAVNRAIDGTTASCRRLAKALRL